MRWIPNNCQPCWTAWCELDDRPATGCCLAVYLTIHRQFNGGVCQINCETTVLGRRNYLFAGSDAGGERAAAIYCLIGTALLNGVEPYGYLRHVLGRIAEHPINRVDELLPWKVAAELGEVHRQAA